MASKYATVIGEKDFRKLEESLKTSSEEAEDGSKKKLGGGGALRKGLGNYLPAAFKFTDEETQTSLESVVSLDLALDSVWDRELNSLGSASPTAKKKRTALLKKFVQRRDNSKAVYELLTSRTQEEAACNVEQAMRPVFQSVKTKHEITRIVIRCRRMVVGWRGNKAATVDPLDARRGTDPDHVVTITIASAEYPMVMIQVRGERISGSELQGVCRVLTETFNATGTDGAFKCADVDSPTETPSSPTQTTHQSMKSLRVIPYESFF